MRLRPRRLDEEDRAMRIPNDTMNILRALPPQVLNDGQTVEAILRRAEQENPDYWTKPITAEACASMLGITLGALATARSRGHGPRCFSTIENMGLRYHSRLEVLRWARTQMGLSSLPPPAARHKPAQVTTMRKAA
jgi:hypothetical protein